MLILYRVALAIMGLSALYAGVLNTILASGVIEQFYEVQLPDPQAVIAIDTQSRILAGMWTAAGLFVLYAMKDIEKFIRPLQFIFLGFALSAIGEFSTQAMLGNTIAASERAEGDVFNPLFIGVTWPSVWSDGKH